MRIHSTDSTPLAAWENAYPTQPRYSGMIFKKILSLYSSGLWCYCFLRLPLVPTSGDVSPITDGHHVQTIIPSSLYITDGSQACVLGIARSNFKFCIYGI